MGSRRLMETEAATAVSTALRGPTGGKSVGPRLPASSLRRNAVPEISPLLLRWFLGYAPRYTRSHFHTVRAGGAEQFAGIGDKPLVIYMNHPGWWDPMIAALLAGHYFPDRSHYTPIDSAALAKYQFFSRLGFFGVEQNSASGARRFLEIGRQIATRGNSVLWITAQGRFSDVRERPVKLAPGLAHLSRYCSNAIIIPMAIEFVYAGERKPEALVRFGNWLVAEQASAKNVTAILERELTHTMDELAACSIKRELGGFETILSGKVGVGGFYDLWRSLKARLRGQKFDPAHGSK